MPIKYISHIPNTVEGQAILDNFVRTRRVLRYRDNDKVFDRVKRGLPLYEIEKIESIGNNPNNLVIRGECLSACAYLKDKGIKVDLVYIDPPFASGANYGKKILLRRHPHAQATALEGPALEADGWEETLYGDIWNKEDYLNWMYENLTAIKAVMSDSASIYVHLDWHIGHYVKILLDEVFGEENFVNEIVWCYSGPTNQKNNFPRKHDTIYLYAKDKSDMFFDSDSIRVAYKKSNKSGGKTGLAGRSDEASLEALDERGKIPEDWWPDIADLGKVHSEDLGYPTQKPEALLERILLRQ